MPTVNLTLNIRALRCLCTAPSRAGNPFKRQARLLAEARAHGDLEYVVIDPALTAAASHASAERNRWVPILPGTDTALAMALISGFSLMMAMRPILSYRVKRQPSSRVRLGIPTRHTGD